jgi:hypothetical protein
VWYYYQLPVFVSYATSADGVNYNEPVVVANPHNPLVSDAVGAPLPLVIKPFFAKMDGKPARYIKVHAESILHFPDWFAEKGHPAILMTDEIIVR